MLCPLQSKNSNSFGVPRTKWIRSFRLLWTNAPRFRHLLIISLYPSVHMFIWPGFGHGSWLTGAFLFWTNKKKKRCLVCLVWLLMSFVTAILVTSIQNKPISGQISCFFTSSLVLKRMRLTCVAYLNTHILTSAITHACSTCTASACAWRWHWQEIWGTSTGNVNVTCVAFL